jgi:hypothetical protein
MSSSLYWSTNCLASVISELITVVSQEPRFNNHWLCQSHEYVIVTCLWLSVIWPGLILMNFLLLKSYEEAIWAERSIRGSVQAKLPIHFLNSRIKECTYKRAELAGYFVSALPARMQTIRLKHVLTKLSFVHELLVTLNTVYSPQVGQCFPDKGIDLLGPHQHTLCCPIKQQKTNC